MPRRRFFVSGDRIRDGVAILTPDQAHHLRTVLRLRAGAEVELFDGAGRSLSGKVEYEGPQTRISALKELEPDPANRFTLALAPALIKADRFEWMLEKATELGVGQFIPLQTRFATVHIPEARLASRLTRWERIVTEASKQSRRDTVPGLRAPLPWTELLAAREYASYDRVMLCGPASERLRPIHTTKERVLLCVGPEGGWADSEVEIAEQAGFRLVSMGSRILRAETAAIAAVSIMQALLEM